MRLFIVRLHDSKKRALLGSLRIGPNVVWPQWTDAELVECVLPWQLLIRALFCFYFEGASA